jgi:CoA:oxalate CoA-transferase
VRGADVLIENYRPDVMPRLGLGYEMLRQVNPRLVMLSISGFGAGGPESQRPAYAPIVHAEVGLMERAARRGDGVRRELPLSVADTNASLHGLVGLLAALLMRERTGQGQHIDIAMVDATVVTDDQLHYDLEDSESNGQLPNDTWETGAGPILVSADFRLVWRQLVSKLGVAEAAAPDADLATKIAARREAVRRFMAGLATWAEVEAAFERMNIAWGEVRPAASLRDQPTLRHRGAIVGVDDRAGGVRPTGQSPYRFSQATSGVRGGAPHRGEHNAEVLAEWLGLSAEEVADLEGAGVLSRDREVLG